MICSILIKPRAGTTRNLTLCEYRLSCITGQYTQGEGRRQVALRCVNTNYKIFSNPWLTQVGNS